MILSGLLTATVAFNEGLPLGSSEEFWAMGESLTRPITGLYEKLQPYDNLAEWATCLLVPANFVPAAAVIQMGLRYFDWIGIKCD